MKKNTSKGLRMLPLLDCDVIPITDPAEQAALERRIREAEKMLAARDAGVKKTKARKRK
jgi:hypothetical protein